MKSTISASLLPSRICSRICRRRSTASSAFDSAIDWFWQTRQRNCSERCMARFSRTGSWSVGTASALHTAIGSSASKITITALALPGSARTAWRTWETIPEKRFIIAARASSRRYASDSPLNPPGFISGIRRCRRRIPLQLPDERQYLALQGLGRDRADLLVADDPLPVDDERLRHSVNAEVDADPAVGIGDAQQIRVA